jgi:hypothetical protein
LRRGGGPCRDTVAMMARDVVDRGDKAQAKLMLPLLTMQRWPMLTALQRRPTRCDGDHGDTAARRRWPLPATPVLAKSHNDGSHLSTTH